jgi:hypothetical protein
MCICIYVCIYIDMLYPVVLKIQRQVTCNQVFVCVCMHLGMYMYVCIYVCIYIYIYIYAVPCCSQDSTAGYLQSGICMCMYAFRHVCVCMQNARDIAAVGFDLERTCRVRLGADMHIHIHTYECMYVYIYMLYSVMIKFQLHVTCHQACFSVFMNMCACIRIYIHVHKSIYSYIYIYIYI